MTEPPVDPPGLGRALFLAGKYDQALTTYRTIDLAEQLPDDRLMIQYMMASCLRKLGQVGEAATLYREVGNSGGEETLVKNAQWHLQSIKVRQELIAELERIRIRREQLTREGR